MKQIMLIALFTGLMMASCSDQIVSSCDDEDVDPGLTATFSSIQSLVITPNCARSGCHVGQNPPEGLNLSAEVSYGNLVDAASRQSSLLLVNPGNSSQSWIINKLNADGTSLMPPGLPLNSAEIDTIIKWIDQGAKND